MSNRPWPAEVVEWHARSRRKHHFRWHQQGLTIHLHREQAASHWHHLPPPSVSNMEKASLRSATSSSLSPCGPMVSGWIFCAPEFYYYYFMMCKHSAGEGLRRNYYLSVCILCIVGLSSPETVLVVEVVSTLRRNVPYLHTSTYFLGHKIHPCLSTNSASEATMVVSGFGPYHRLVHDDAPTGHAGVILTPWAMPIVLGLGAIHLGGEWHVPPPPPCICPILRWAHQHMVCHDFIWINATTPHLLPP